MNFVQTKPSTPASSLNSRCMASSGVSSVMLSPIFPPTPLSNPCCHSGFDLRMSTTFESVGSSMKPTQYLVFNFLVNGFLHFHADADESCDFTCEIFQHF